MKKLMFMIAFVAIAIMTRAQSAAQQVVKTEIKVDSAKARLEAAKAKHDAAEEAYIKDMKHQLDVNDAKIKELRAKMVKPLNSPVNDSTKHLIKQIESRNDDLRNKLGN